MKILQLFAKVIIFTEIIKQEESTRNYFPAEFLKEKYFLTFDGNR